MQWTYCMKLLTCEALIALSLTVFYLLFLCPLSTRILSDLRLFVICLFPSTEMEERSIHGNNGKVFQSHKLYFWQLPIKWPFNSKATTLRNGRLPQRCYSRVKDKSAGGARIWSHYTSECINEYDTDVLIFFMHIFAGILGLEAWWVVLFILGSCDMICLAICWQE